MSAIEDWELHPDRLGTLDDKGSRAFVYTADVRGFYRTLKTRLQVVLVLFYLILPWIKINGRQIILLNIPNRHFDIFGLTLRAHDVPLLFFFLAAVAVTMALVTAIWGRVWCGYACPQTVFIDGVYRRIERWLEGPASERIVNDKKPMTMVLFVRKTIKWILFLLVTFVITHTFLAYFVGSERMLNMIQHSPTENWFDFVLVMVTSGILLFNFTWFREQFCIILCPYGRLQSVLMDVNTLVVAYDTKRGEPRRGSDAFRTADRKGDCINCFRCVQVCPTRIDIRRGTQMECIACAACADACDEVMTKLKKPTGLIRYVTELGLQGQKPKRLRIRTALYSLFLLTVLSGFAYSLAKHEDLVASLTRIKGQPYDVLTQQKESGQVIHIVNRFNLKLSNQARYPSRVEIQLDPAWVAQGMELITPQKIVNMPAESIQNVPVFLQFPRELLQGGSGSQVSIQLIMRPKEQEQGQEEVGSQVEAAAAAPEIHVKVDTQLIGPL